MIFYTWFFTHDLHDRLHLILHHEIYLFQSWFSFQMSLDFSTRLHLICTWVVTLDFYTWFCALPHTSFRKWHRKHTTLDFLTFCHLISCTLDYIRCTLEIKNQVWNFMFFYTWFLSFWCTWFVNTFTWFYQMYTWFKSSA